ncbi:hypothetical protein [Streptomyces sp. bgisy022]|uniref:hypothetical protein n=1 Tax=Streptomyces sp. bgisy022 TaxID=3413769 RepID=UPI003D759B88
MTREAAARYGARHPMRRRPWRDGPVAALSVRTGDGGRATADGPGSGRIPAADPALDVQGVQDAPYAQDGHNAHAADDGHEDDARSGGGLG